MKCKGYEHYGKGAKVIVAEPNGKKVDGKAVWVDADGKYYERRNNAAYNRPYGGKMKWVFFEIGKDYVDKHAK